MAILKCGKEEINQLTKNRKIKRDPHIERMTEIKPFEYQETNRKMDEGQ